MQDFRLVEMVKDHYGIPHPNTMLSEALGLTNFKYKIPKSPKERLYDFYLMTLLGPPKMIGASIESRIWGDRFKGEGTFSAYFDHEQIAEIVAVATEIQNRLFRFLRKDLLDAVYFSIAAEMKHVTTQGGKTHNGSNEDVYNIAKNAGYGKEIGKWLHTFLIGKNLTSPSKYVLDKMDPNDPLAIIAIRARLYTDPTDRKVVITNENGKDITKKVADDSATFFTNNADRIASYVAAKRAFKGDDFGFIDLAERCFEDLNWQSSYGGPAWANICKGWKHLYAASEDLSMMIIYIDHIFDLQHNTGTVLNKVQRYATDGGFGWLKQALDYKRDSKKPLIDFDDKISAGMRFFNDRVRYAVTGVAKDRSGMLDEYKKKQVVGNSVPNGIPAAPFKVGQSYPLKKDKHPTSSASWLNIYFEVKAIGSSGKIYMTPSSKAESAVASFVKALHNDPNHTYDRFSDDVLKFAPLDPPSIVVCQGYVKGGYKSGGDVVFISEPDMQAIVGPVSFYVQGAVANSSGIHAPTTATEPKPTTEPITGPPNFGTPTPPPATDDQKGQIPSMLAAYTHFSSKPIKHTGPAGIKGAKSLIVNLSKYQESGYGRSDFSGYFKIKKGNKYNALSFDPLKLNGPPVGFYIGAGHITPKQDKVVVKSLKFKKVGSSRLVFYSGTIANAYFDTNTAGFVFKPLLDQSSRIIFTNCAFSGLGMQILFHVNKKTSKEIVFDSATYQSLLDHKTIQIKISPTGDNVSIPIHKGFSDIALPIGNTTANILTLFEIIKGNDPSTYTKFFGPFAGTKGDKGDEGDAGEQKQKTPTYKQSDIIEALEKFPHNGTQSGKKAGNVVVGSLIPYKNSLVKVKITGGSPDFIFSHDPKNFSGLKYIYIWDSVNGQYVGSYDLKEKTLTLYKKEHGPTDETDLNLASSVFAIPKSELTNLIHGLNPTLSDKSSYIPSIKKDLASIDFETVSKADSVKPSDYTKVYAGTKYSFVGHYAEAPIPIFMVTSHYAYCPVNYENILGNVQSSAPLKQNTVWVWDSHYGLFLGAFNIADGKFKSYSGLTDSDKEPTISHLSDSNLDVIGPNKGEFELPGDKNKIDVSPQNKVNPDPQATNTKPTLAQKGATLTTFNKMVKEFKGWAMENYSVAEPVTNTMLNAFRQAYGISAHNPLAKKLYVFVAKNKSIAQIQLNFNVFEQVQSEGLLFRDFFHEKM